MTLRSQYETSLAGELMRILGNVLTLTSVEERRTLPTVPQILEATPQTATAPLSLFRLMQFAVLPEIFGESAGAATYFAAKRFSQQLAITSLDDLKEWFFTMQLGELEIELDDERVVVKLERCLSSEALPPTGTPICDLERGIIDGVLEVITGTEVLTRETQCASLGDALCQFEGYTGSQEGYQYPDNGFHSDVRRRLLGQIADQAEVAVDNLRLLRERQARETRDPLTGLMNFRHLRECADQELARAARYGRTVTFAMLDLDHFGSVNEEYGRESGDEVLRYWAAALLVQLRSCDLVCRYGADEYLIVLPETAEEQADAVLERVLATMRELAIDVNGTSVILSASVGVASYPKDGQTVEEFVAKAATTMCLARAAGEGRIAFYSRSRRS